MKNRILIVFYFCMICIGLGNFCHTPAKDSSPVIANVGSSTLTLKNLEESFPKPANVHISEVQIQRYVQQWIESELIYQEAIRRKINLQPSVRQHIKELERDYIVSSFLDQFVDQDLTVTDDEIKKFYEDNSAEFIRAKDEYKLQIIFVKTLTAANEARNRAVSGEDFAQVAKEVSFDASKKNGGDLGWITLDEIPETIAASIPSQVLNTISWPKKTPIGFYIIKVNGKRAKGDVQTIDEVKDTLVWRIKAGKRGEKYHRLITLLTENAVTEVDWKLTENVLKDIKNDTTKSKTN
jgi:hypothetical protein